MKKLVFFLMITMAGMSLTGCGEAAMAAKSDVAAEKSDVVAATPREFFSADLQVWLDEESRSSADAIDVLIALKDDSWQIQPGYGSITGSAEIVDGEVVFVEQNGSKLSRGEQLEFNKKRTESLSEAYEMRKKMQDAALDQLLSRLNWNTRSGGIEKLTPSTIKKQLTKDEILNLQNSDDLVLGVELYILETAELSSAVQDMGLNDYAHPNSKNGSGIGIYQREAAGSASADTSSSLVNASRYTLIEGSPSSTSSHATNVAACLQAAAPDAEVYCSGEYFVPGDPASYNPPIYITNHSWGFDKYDNSYKIQDRDFDNDIYNNRLIQFKSAGNNAAEITSPGNAFNIITVGAYNDVTDTMYPDSNYIDPETGCEKPEVVAPGQSLTFGSSTNSGTSYAAPLMAGATACLLEGLPWLAGNVPLVKAMLMGATQRNIEGAEILSDKDGAGALSFNDLYFNGAMVWWDGNNGDYFDSNQDLFVDNANLVPGKKYGLTLVWLVPGDYAYTNKKPSMDLDLYVYSPSGSQIARSWSANNSFEMVEFTASATGTHRFKIHRYWNSGQGNVIMALYLKYL